MIKAKLKQWLGVISLEQENKVLRSIIEAQSKRVTARIKELDKLTAIDADIGVRGPCTIILTGVYRGRGYVRFYDMPHEEFEHWVKSMREGERRSLIRNVDYPPQYLGSFGL